MPPARGPPLAAAVRVIDRVHRHPAHRRPAATPARCPRLAERAERMFRVPDLADCRAAGHGHLSQLSGTQPQRGEPPFPRDELDAGPRRCEPSGRPFRA